MTDIERNKLRLELEVEYNKCMYQAHDKSRDGLAYHLMAAKAQYKLAELALTPESRLAHESTARTIEAFVAERKKVLSVENALADHSEGPNASQAVAPGAADVAAQPSTESPAKETPRAKADDSELRGFDPENCRVKKVPEVSFNDIIGSEKTIEALVKAFHHNEELFKYQRLIKLAPLASQPIHHLMYGPPGTGKSMLCSAIAHAVMTQYPNTPENPKNSAFFNVNSAEICSPLYSVAEKRLNALFAAAEEYNHCVICIDEMERLCPDRNATGAELTSVADAIAIVTRMLQLIDGVASKCNAIVLCATNYPWKVDKAMRDRLSSKLLLNLPQEEAKIAYLERNAGIFLGATDADRRQAIDSLMCKLEHASYRDLTNLAKEIQLTSLDKTISNHPGEYDLSVFDPLTQEELEQKLSNVVISYDEDYHERLANPALWAN